MTKTHLIYTYILYSKYKHDHQEVCFGVMWKPVFSWIVFIAKTHFMEVPLKRSTAPGCLSFSAVFQGNPHTLTYLN